MPLRDSLTKRSADAGGPRFSGLAGEHAGIAVPACWAAQAPLAWNVTLPVAFAGSHFQPPVASLPACALTVSGGLHAGTPPSVMLLTVLPPGLPQETNC